MPISILSQSKIFLINRTKSASNVPTQEINQKTKSRKEKTGKIWIQTHAISEPLLRWNSLDVIKTNEDIVNFLYWCVHNNHILEMILKSRLNEIKGKKKHLHLNNEKWYSSCSLTYYHDLHIIYLNWCTLYHLYFSQVDIIYEFFMNM